MKPTPHPPSPHLAFARARYQWSSPPAFDPRSPPLSRTYAQSAAYTPSHRPHTTRPPSSRVHPAIPPRTSRTPATTAYTSVVPAACVPSHLPHTYRPAYRIHLALPTTYILPHTPLLPSPSPSTSLPPTFRFPHPPRYSTTTELQGSPLARSAALASTRGDERKGEGGG